MKIKIGDKVRIIDNKHGHGFNIGEIVEITKINRPCYEAKSVLRNGYLWYIEDDEIEKENKSMFTKSDLRIGDMVELRGGEKFIVTSENNLSSTMRGHMRLSSYDENMFLIKEESDDYKNDKYDIIMVYNVDKYGNYEGVWDREKEETLTKEYLIKQVDTSEECKDEHWDIKISPNNFQGYGKSDGNMQIVLSSVNDYDDDSLFLSVQGAKEMVKALNEIIDYLEE